MNMTPNYSAAANGFACPSCRRAKPGPGTCPACGWSASLDRRMCRFCEGPVMMYAILEEGSGRAMAGGFGGVAGFVFFRIFGILLGPAIILGFASIATACAALTARYRCDVCKVAADTTHFAPVDKDALHKLRVKYWKTTAVCLGIALVLFIAWIAVVVALASN